MNSKGDEQLKTLSELAAKNNFTILFLNNQIALGRLMFEKKGKIFYSSQTWLEQYKKDFTFSGFMLDRVFPETKKDNFSETKKVLSVNKQKTKDLGNIIKEEKVNIDIEEAFVNKWNNEFRKINNDFNSLIKTSKTKSTHQANKDKKSKNEFVSNPHNVHSAIMAVAIMFLLSFYTVILMPNTADAFTRKIDAIIKSPHHYINQLALSRIIDEERASLEADVPSPEQLSKFIKNKASNISYPVGTSINLREDEIFGRVAGIEEEFKGDNLGFIEKLKATTVEVFTKISDKQKRASLKLNDKLNNLISSIKD